MTAGVGDVELDVGGLDGDAAAAGHGVAGVHRQVEKDLLQLTGVHLDQPGAGAGGDDALDVLADQAAEHLFGVGNGGVEVDDLGHDHLSAAEDQQLPGQGRGPLAGLANLGHQFRRAVARA